MLFTVVKVDAKERSYNKLKWKKSRVMVVDTMESV